MNSHLMLLLAILTRKKRDCDTRLCYDDDQIMNTEGGLTCAEECAALTVELNQSSANSQRGEGGPTKETVRPAGVTVTIQGRRGLPKDERGVKKGVLCVW